MNFFVFMFFFYFCKQVQGTMELATISRILLSFCAKLFNKRPLNL